MLFTKSLKELILCNIRTYLREPEVIFWTYGFPILMVLGLGLAFQAPTQVQYRFALLESPAAGKLQEKLPQESEFHFQVVEAEQGRELLRGNRVDLLVEVKPDGSLEYSYDDTNPEARVTRFAVDRLLQTLHGRKEAVSTSDRFIRTPGSRYVDFLVPGLIGMNLMGGGIWGVGFVLVDMRVKKLLKRLLGTPLPPYQLLLSLVGSRLCFFLPEGLVLLAVSYLIFSVPIVGSLPALIGVMLAGALCFAGLGLLIASRARRIEVVSGLMNVVMLPMWLCSGIFFSAERFPDWMQPFIQALPLTQLINALRAIMLEGSPLAHELWALSSLALWTLATFLLAFRLFRWED